MWKFYWEINMRIWALPLELACDVADFGRVIEFGGRFLCFQVYVQKTIR